MYSENWRGVTKRCGWLGMANESSLSVGEQSPSRSEPLFESQRDILIAGWDSQQFQRVHIPQIGGSNPPPTIFDALTGQVRERRPRARRRLWFQDTIVVVLGLCGSS